MAINEFEKAGFDSVFDNTRVNIVLDHFVPNKDIKSAQPSKHCLLYTSQPDISDAPRARVREAAERLGYVPNMAARSMKTTRTSVSYTHLHRGDTDHHQRDGHVLGQHEQQGAQNGQHAREQLGEALSLIHISAVICIRRVLAWTRMRSR